MFQDLKEENFSFLVLVYRTTGLTQLEDLTELLLLPGSADSVLVSASLPDQGPRRCRSYTTHLPGGFAPAQQAG